MRKLLKLCRTFSKKILENFIQIKQFHIFLKEYFSRKNNLKFYNHFIKKLETRTKLIKEFQILLANGRLLKISIQLAEPDIKTKASVRQSASIAL